MTQREKYPIGEPQLQPEQPTEPETAPVSQSNAERSSAESIFNRPLKAAWGWAPLAGREQPAMLLKPGSQNGYPGVLVVDPITGAEEFHSGFLRISFAGLTPSVETRQRASQVTPIPVEDARSHRIEVALIVSPRPPHNSPNHLETPDADISPEL